MKKCPRMLVLAVAVLFMSLPSTVNAAQFVVVTNGYNDNAILPVEMGWDKNDAAGNSCRGKNTAPGWSWLGASDKAQSFAILIVDPGGAGGAGVNHWVVYNIPGTATGISTADIAAAKYSQGRGTADFVGYRGPCPGIGDAAHHYVVILFALDAPPSLPPNLDHDGLLAAMKGHIIAVTTTSFRFQRL